MKRNVGYLCGLVTPIILLSSWPFISERTGQEYQVPPDTNTRIQKEKEAHRHSNIHSEAHIHSNIHSEAHRHSNIHSGLGIRSLVFRANSSFFVCERAKE